MEWIETKKQEPPLHKLRANDEQLKLSDWLLAYNGHIFWSRLIVNERLKNKYWSNSGGVNPSHWMALPLPPDKE